MLLILRIIKSDWNSVITLLTAVTFFFIIYCALTVLIEGTKSLKSRFGKPTNVIRVVKPITLRTFKFVAEKTKDGILTLKKVYNDVKIGEQEEIYARKSKKEKDLEEKLEKEKERVNKDIERMVKKHGKSFRESKEFTDI